MIREVNLISYLPQFIAEYKEINTTLSTENPEFKIIWEKVNKALYNEFIDTADEYGIARFEKILNILPLSNDTIEDRRTRVKIRWFVMTPYTLMVLILKLADICLSDNFCIYTEYDKYNVYIRFSDNIKQTMLKEALIIIDEMFPANIKTTVLFKNIHKFFSTATHAEMKKYTHRQLQNDVLKFGYTYIKL